MKENLLRSYIRELLQEESSSIPLNKWVMLKSGDPRRWRPIPAPSGNESNDVTPSILKPGDRMSV